MRPGGNNIQSLHSNEASIHTVHHLQAKRKLHETEFIVKLAQIVWLVPGAPVYVSMLALDALGVKPSDQK